MGGWSTAPPPDPPEVGLPAFDGCDAGPTIPRALRRWRLLFDHVTASRDPERGTGLGVTQFQRVTH